MVRIGYKDNDYRAFIASVNDEHTLKELIDGLSGAGYEGTYFEGRLPTEVFAGQYRVLEAVKSTILLDTQSQNKIYVSGMGLERFLELANENLLERCDGLDYSSYCTLKDHLNQDD